MQSQEKTKITSFSHPWRVFVLEAFLFLLTLALGIATAFKINKIAEIEKMTLPQIPLWKFILYFLLTTLFIFLISFFLKFQRGKNLIFKIIFVVTIFVGGITFLSVWLPDIISLIAITILILWWLKRPSIFIQDLCIIFGITGAGSILGVSLNPQIVVFLLIIFSIYDWIAVYKTKHMVRMAKKMIESRAILALVVPENFPGFQESLREVRPGGKFLILGGGDIVFPLLFSASLVSSGVLNALIVAVFSLIGLFVSFFFFISQKVRKPIPALPPIALFSIIGYLITKLF